MKLKINSNLKGAWIGVAFAKGNIYKPYDDLIMGATWGNMTHCELLLGKDNVAQAYTSYEGIGFVQSMKDNFDNWNIIYFPVQNHLQSFPFVLRALSANIPYNSKDLWQCCIKTMLPMESELDCNVPELWSQTGVFCSQICLLFLRKFARDKIITCPAQLSTLLENTHSRGCSPNTLFFMLNQFSK